MGIAWSRPLGPARARWPTRPSRPSSAARSSSAIPWPGLVIPAVAARDAAVTPPRGAEYAARLGVTPIDLDCAHNPMLSAVEELADVLLGL